MDAGDGNELQPGAWTYVAMVHDGAKDKIYINGVSVAEKDVSGTLNSTVPIRWAWALISLTAAPISTEAWTIFQIYNVALTSQEIADLCGAVPASDRNRCDAAHCTVNFAATVNFTDVSSPGCLPPTMWA